MAKLDRAKIRLMSSADVTKLRTNAAAKSELTDANEIVAWCDDELASRRAKGSRKLHTSPQIRSVVEYAEDALPEEIKAKAGKIWVYVNRGAQFPWPKSAKSRANLSRSIGKIISDESTIDTFVSALDLADKEAFNIKLREVVSPHLLKSLDDKSERISAWIVRDWGGIRAGNVSVFTQWIAQIRQFGVDAFIDEMGVRRISSWSKILAFSDPDNHAIYDARTAVALNCALSSLGLTDRFFMPMSQNRIIAATRDTLSINGKECQIGYRAYIALLREISAVCEVGSILKVEMALFANGPDIGGSSVS